MKSLLTSKRSKAILDIGAISKKVTRHPRGGCMTRGQEMTFNLGKSNFIKPWIS